MASYQRITLSQLKDRLRAKLGNNSVFWVSQELQDGINEALSLWQLMTGEFTTSFSRPVLSGNFYETPRQIMSLQRVKWNSTPLVNISLFELDNGFIGWQGVSGDPRFWAPIGLNKVAIYPAPSTGTLTFEGLKEGYRLLTDGDFLEMGDETISNILDYVKHYCTIKEGGAELEGSLGILSEFVLSAGKWNGKLKATALYRNAMGQMRDEKEERVRVSENVGVRL